MGSVRKLLFKPLYFILEPRKFLLVLWFLHNFWNEQWQWSLLRNIAIQFLYKVQKGRCLFETIFNEICVSLSVPWFKYSLKCYRKQEYLWNSVTVEASPIFNNTKSTNLPQCGHVRWEQCNISATFEVFTAMKIQVVVFWIVMPCSDVVGYERSEVLAASILTTQKTST